jgi:hypothetical protein
VMLTGGFEEFAVMDIAPFAYECDPMWGIDCSPADLSGLDEPYSLW